MDCACLVHNICGYYNKGVYVQLITSTSRRHFRGRKHCPTRKCIYPKGKPTKNGRKAATVPSPRGAFVGLSLPKQNSKPSQIEIWNIIIQWSFCQILECQPPCTNIKPPIENYLATVLGRNHGNLTKGTSELHERALIPRKDGIAICCWEECRKGFNFCWRSKTIVEPKLAPQKIHIWGVLHLRGAYFHTFKTSDQVGHTCVGSQKLRWPRSRPP